MPPYRLPAPAILRPLLWGGVIWTLACGPTPEQGTHPHLTPTTKAAPIAPAPTPNLSLPQTPLKGRIVIDGSSTVFPVTEKLVMTFRAAQPDVEIRLGVSGTGGGFKKFCRGETVISNASRPIKREELAECSAAGITVVELPVAYDGLSVVVHANNDWATCLRLDELRRLWEPAATGKILRWCDLRPTWPDRPVVLFGAGRDSGTFDYFTTAVVGQEGKSRLDYVASEDDYLLAQGVAGQLDSLAFFGFAYYREYQATLRAVAIDAGQGCVAPSLESIRDGSYRPLARPIFIYVAARALDDPAVAAFVEHVLQQVAAAAESVRYVALPPRAYELARARVAKRQLGSLFDGGSQVGLSIEELLGLESADAEARP